MYSEKSEALGRQNSSCSYRASSLLHLHYSLTSRCEVLVSESTDGVLVLGDSVGS